MLKNLKRIEKLGFPGDWKIAQLFPASVLLVMSPEAGSTTICACDLYGAHGSFLKCPNTDAMNESMHIPI
jgi:hypothetical protein